MDRDQAWQEARQYTPEQLALAREVLAEVRAGRDLFRSLRRHPQPGGGYLPKHLLVYAYRELTRTGEWAFDDSFLRRIRMKPVRTLSGVTTVTVLTRPWPCPGDCLFCPTEDQMPKSYVADEPGARRAVQHGFDPYRQTAARLEALEAIGHPTEKIELLILGGSWSAYPPEYQDWFVQRCLEAMNGTDSASLAEAQRINADGQRRNVGLVVETRPDMITPAEVARLRSLGVTKVQLGAQSLDDRILELNRRGHTVEATRRAVSLLRAAGFKVVLHWMPNLRGADLVSDRRDFPRLWDDPDLRPDEIKIYPCQLLANTDLYEVWQRGEYVPYTTEELIELIADLKTRIPRYCRVNRVVRDIPSTRVVAGNKRTSLRMDVHEALRKSGRRCECIRCREVRGRLVDPGEVHEEGLTYAAAGGTERFLSLVTPDDRLAAYLRLWLPGAESPDTGLAVLRGAALVRELHVYGQSLPVGAASEGEAQHAGLGARLMAEAEALSAARQFRRLAVIAALGTREYYRRLGYRLEETYMVKTI